MKKTRIKFKIWAMAAIMLGAAAGSPVSPVIGQGIEPPPSPPETSATRSVPPKGDWRLLQECREAYDVRDYITVENTCTPLAEKGVAEAQRLLGMTYLAGYGVFDRDRRAEKWIRAAAEGGDPKAQFTLGTMYLHGKTVTKLDSAAAGWILKAAEQGLPEAQESIAYMYLVGQGVKKTPDRAIFWYEQAVKKRYPPAMYNLGVLYYKGQVVAQDMDKALSLLRRAAAMGNEDAKKTLDFIDPRR